MSPSRAREVYTLRALLEPYALRAALVEGRIRRAEMTRIEAAYGHMVACAEGNDVAALIEADMAFHCVRHQTSIGTGKPVAEHQRLRE